ncbi:hypothetical protein EI94DRAFT_1768304 [Lactarius quietus]|nr:hypothetical protein EI94DRAFT_1768304 [Lactarius quietus]
MRTYSSSRSSRKSTYSSPQPTRKRPLAERLSFHNTPQTLKPAPAIPSGSALVSKSKTKRNPKGKEDRPPKNLTQLHFTLDSSILRTCPLCDLTYTKGAPEDETLHNSHCARVQRGMQWRRDEERAAADAHICEIATGVKLKDGKLGRIISVSADVGGKIGTKLATLLQTISLHLSSPSLTRDVLRVSKVYLFLIPSEKSLSCETIAGLISPPTARLVSVDPSSGLFCRPEPLPTPMGISRLFVPSAYQRRGIALRLLDTAAATFVHGCPLDPTCGEVAFTQPTASGKALMEKWGGGYVRIYQE